MPYPVTFKADYVEKRSRLTTFFRLILAIPHFIAVTFYFLAAEVVVIISWFALLFTGRYPQGMYDFVAGALRYQTRVYGYAGLLADEYPPFSGDPATPYPVDLVIGPPKAEYSRLKVLFRLILAIPVLIIQYAMQIVAQVGAFLAWFAIVVLGRQPKGLQDMIALGAQLQQRATAYLALLTEDWPPFTDDTTGRTVEAAPAFGALAATPPAAGPEHADLGAAGRLRLARARGGLPVRAGAAAAGRAGARARAADPRSSRRPTSRPRRRRRRPRPPEPEPEPPAREPGHAAPTAGDPLGRRRPRPPPARAGARARARPEPGDWPDAPPEAAPPSPGDWPDPEPPREPPRGRRRGRAAARPLRAELDEPLAALCPRALRPYGRPRARGVHQPPEALRRA